MIVDRIDATWWHKLNGGLRYALVRSHGAARMPLVNEFPKSGGTWLTQMISEATGLPFPRDRLPMTQPSLLHGHYRYRSGMKNVILLWRDGRDIMVSWYFHRLNETAHTSAAHTARIRAALGITDVADIEANLPKFIEYCMTTPDHPRFSWPDFVNDWAGRDDCLHLRYEGLLTAPIEALEQACDFIGKPRPEPSVLQEIVERHSFAAQTKRKAGQEDTSSFLRKGIAGDWRNKFSPEATEVFNHYAGDALDRLGYGRD